MRIALAVTLMMAFPAEAAAHCYSVWHYKFPQRCGVAVARAEVWENKPMPPSPPIGLREQPDIPLLQELMRVPTIPAPPEEWDTVLARALAVQKLRERQK
jgi:hypothetical protein